MEEAEVQRVVAVLDTSPLIRYASGNPALLGRGARRILRGVAQRDAKVGVPTVCLFEVAQLEERGRVDLGLSFDRWCQLVEDSRPLLLLPLERAHVAEARALPLLREPFDRLIAGTAAALGVPLVSSDERLRNSGRLKVVW